MSFRSGLLVAALCAGCATAGHPNQQPPGDAPGQADSPPGRPDASPGRDAMPPPDGSFTQPDTGGGGPCSYAGVLATWTLTGQAGNEASVPGTSSGGGVTAGSLGRAAGLNTATGSDSINSSNWTTAAQPDASKYYTLTISPPSGCSLSLTQMAIDTKASATGPASAEVATSAGNFTDYANVGINAQSTPSLTVTNQTGSVEIRVYGYGASSASGTLRLQNTLTVSGSLN